MTDEERKLLCNIATLVCVLSHEKAVEAEIEISNALCDGPDSARARGMGVKKEQKKLKEYQKLILETKNLAHDLSINLEG